MANERRIDYRNFCPALMMFDQQTLKPDSEYIIKVIPKHLNESHATCPVGSDLLDRKDRTKNILDYDQERIDIDDYADDLSGIMGDTSEFDAPSYSSETFDSRAIVHLYRTTRYLSDEQVDNGKKGEICMSCEGCPLLPNGFEELYRDIKKDSPEKKQKRIDNAARYVAEDIAETYKPKASIRRVIENLRAVVASLDGSVKTDGSFDELYGKYLKDAKIASKGNQGAFELLKELTDDALDGAQTLGDQVANNGEIARNVRMHQHYKRSNLKKH